MALKLAGEEIGIQEKVETIKYLPGLQDSGDLEGATKTITATSKPGTPDYSTSLTVPSPPDARLSIGQLGLRLKVHIDSFGGAPAATKLYATVEVKGTILNRINAFEFTSAGADNFASSEVTVFNIGTANDVKVYFWVDQGEAVISVCQVLLAVGQGGQLYECARVLNVDHSGFVSFSVHWKREGTGNHYIYVTSPKNVWDETAGLWSKTTSSAAPVSRDYDFPQVFMVNTFSIALRVGVATDLVYINEIRFHLRSVV